METLRRTYLLGLCSMTLMIATGCGDPSTTAGAVTAASIAVAGSAVNRAATKDCWARCSQGWVCNQESGLCEKGECIPGCAPGYACTRSRAGNTCVADGAPLVDPVRDPSRADRLGPIGVPGDPLAPETSAERNLRAPERNEGGQIMIPRGTQGPVDASGGVQRDEVRKIPQVELQQRGATILGELEALVAAWAPRLTTGRAEFPQTVQTPSPPPFIEYAEMLHRSSLHDVFSRGWLESLGNLSRTHALSNLELEVTVGVAIAKDTGALEKIVVLQSSGSELFDVGTLEAIARAAPFPPPPESLLVGASTLYLKWQLFRHADYACSTSFVERLLPERP